MRKLFAVPFLLGAATAAAAAPLPLAQGVYVSQGTPCSDPPFAAMRFYDGRGLSDPHSHDCRARLLWKKGTRYRIDNDCIAAGAGAAPRDVEHLTITVRSRSAFTLGRPSEATQFRLCPALALPPALGHHGRS